MASTKPKPKRTPRRAAKDRYEEEKLMTSDKSQLIDLDLVKLLALPEAWSCLDEAEKKEILDQLPSDTHPNPHPSSDDPDAGIPPLPGDFLRYSNFWRDGIRNFQLDLQNGRHDPQWMREAEEAVQQRAAGKFDKFKELEFEEFWGQKQKMDRALTAGASSKIKLSTLVEHDVIRKGDIWKWSKSFKREASSILVEKEARLIGINSGKLTFAVAPGQDLYLKTTYNPDAPRSTSTTRVGKPVTTLESPPPSTPKNAAVANGTMAEDSKMDSDAKDPEAGSSRKRSAEPETETKPAKRTRGRQRRQEPETAPVEEEPTRVTVKITNPKTGDTKALPLSSPHGNVEAPVGLQNGGSEADQEAAENVKPEVAEEAISSAPAENATPDGALSQQAFEANGEPDEVIIPDIQGPTALTLKILEVDGRIANATNGNAWKELRCFRDNQDMGTLWEVRHAWYIKNQ
ncbi:Asx homology domain-containing protein [Aspergillus oleicola]